MPSRSTLPESGPGKSRLLDLIGPTASHDDATSVDNDTPPAVSEGQGGAPIVATREIRPKRAPKKVEQASAPVEVGQGAQEERAKASGRVPKSLLDQVRACVVALYGFMTRLRRDGRRRQYRHRQEGESHVSS